MTQPLEHLSVDTGDSPEDCIVWLHGLGADGHDFEPVVPQLAAMLPHATRFVFPHAPVRPVTVNNGMRMRAWYDIASLDIAGRQDEAGIHEATDRVEALLAAQARQGFEPGRTVLAGFSQGGAIALHAGLRHETRLAGLLALSCYLPLHDALSTEAAPANRETPIFMAHGSQDPVVPQVLGERSRDCLREHGYRVAWHSYPVPHGVCQEEIRDIGEWLGGILAA